MIRIIKEFDVANTVYNLYDNDKDKVCKFKYKFYISYFKYEGECFPIDFPTK